MYLQRPKADSVTWKHNSPSNHEDSKDPLPPTNDDIKNFITEISLTFSTETANPVGDDILACNLWNLNVKTILYSFGIPD